MQDDQQHQRHRRTEVQGPRGGLDDGCGIAKVRFDVGARTLRGAGHERPGVQQHDGVVVRVNDPRVRRDRLGHLVGVIGHRQAGADIQELAEAALPGQIAHRPITGRSSRR